MIPYVRDLQEGDLEFLADNLRDADKREIEAASGLSNPLTALRLSVPASANLKIIEFERGRPCAIYGTSQQVTPVASVWLLATTDVEKHAVPFLRYSRPNMRRLFETTGAKVFYNYTHVPNTLHHKWLRWCGASLGDVVYRGPASEPFYPFVIHRSHHVLADSDCGRHGNCEHGGDSRSDA